MKIQPVGRDFENACKIQVSENREVITFKIGARTQKDVKNAG
jgi:hypothetical protein